MVLQALANPAAVSFYRTFFLAFFFLTLTYIITRLWVANGDDVGLALPINLRAQS
jgi:hypothetical protein